MLTFKLSPLLHLHHHSLWAASLTVRVKSLLSLFRWCRILKATPGPNLRIRRGGYREHVSKALWWKGEIGGTGVYWSQCWSLCSLVVLAFRLNKSVSMDHELINYPQPSSNKENTTLTSTRPCWQADRRGNRLFICLKLNAVMIYNFKLHNIPTPGVDHIVKERDKTLCI